jgi:hypothetical protein
MRNAGFGSAFLCTSVLVLGACSSSSSPTDGGGQSSGCAAGCGTGLSCLENSDFPTGACTSTCSPGGAACPGGTVCSPLLSSGNNYCLQDCTSAACPSPLQCTGTADGRLCLAPSAAPNAPTTCAAPSVVVGTVAGPPSAPASCQNPRVSSALPAGDVQLLGTHLPGEAVSFNVPAGAVGFSIVSQAASGQNDFIDCPGQGTFANVPLPTPILLPGGGTFFDANENPLDSTTAPLLFILAGGQQPYAAALTFPNTSEGLVLAGGGGLPGGTWSFDVNDLANDLNGLGLGACDAGTVRNSYDVQVVVTPGPLPSTGQIGLDIYLISKTLTAATVATSAGMQRFASRFSSVYANAGLCVTTLTLHDVPTWAQDAYASVDVDDTMVQDPCSDFRQMFILAEPGRTMALFFVDDITASGVPGGGKIVGQDGVIPGMATYNGTIAGGAVVLSTDLSATAGCGTALNVANCGPDEVALIAAHETGHFLGLVHPTEDTGDAFDPLVDTASCVCALCETNPSKAANCSVGASPTVVDNTVCSGTTQQCGGANLLMFWLLTSSMDGSISPEQAAVMRSNPLISAP